MELNSPTEATRGGDAILFAGLAVSHGPAESHWFRVDVTGPDGREHLSYSRNVEAPNGRTEIKIPFSLNDAAGAWKVRVQDVASGVAAESRIQLK